MSLCTSDDFQDIVEAFVQSIADVGTEQQVDILSQLFSHFAQQSSNLFVPNDFLALAYKAMCELRASGRSNVVYSLSSTKRPGGSDTLLPTKECLWGSVAIFLLLPDWNRYYWQYTIIHAHIHTLTHTHTHILITQVKCLDDYRTWLSSMFSMFGTKWVKLFSGPMWNYNSPIQDGPPPSRVMFK